MKLRSVLLERILAQDAFPGAGGMAWTRFFRGLFASLQMIAASLLAAFFWLPWHVYSYLLGVCTGIAVAYAACLPGGRRMAWRDARPFLPLLLLYLLFLLGVLFLPSLIYDLLFGHEAFRNLLRDKIRLIELCVISFVLVGIVRLVLASYLMIRELPLAAKF